MSRKKRCNSNKNNFSEREDDKGFSALSETFHPIQKVWRRLDPYQYNYAKSLGDYRVVMVDAKAGTGKTSIAVMRAFQMLSEGKVNRIQYVRFPDSRALKLGFLPGYDKEKEKGFMKPFYQAAAEIGLREEDIAIMINNEVIELSTDIHLRGTTMSGTFLIVDETQNGDIPDLKLVLTRLSENGYGAVIGHSGQMDSKLPRYGRDQWNAFQVFQCHMAKKTFTTICELQHDYRGAISRWADKVDETLQELQA